MTKIDKHIYFTNEEYVLINNYCKDKKVSFSKAISQMIEKANRYDTFLDKLNSIENESKFIAKKLNVLYSLLEQMYSDFDFSNVTDITKSKALKEFKDKLRRDLLND